ncbi:unnamed protein product [Haemonchus placei]|uniref:Replication protein A subunit n=1 Tax=Haemonchus placei TaxID=6290 RepID=A0A0N4X7S6_HAEPC|nr:unnamed protein product [Haemonchus placei]
MSKSASQNPTSDSPERTFSYADAAKKSSEPSRDNSPACVAVASPSGKSESPAPTTPAPVSRPVETSDTEVLPCANVSAGASGAADGLSFFYDETEAALEENQNEADNGATPEGAFVLNLGGKTVHFAKGMASSPVDAPPSNSHHMCMVEMLAQRWKMFQEGHEMSSPVKVTPAQYRKYGVNGTLQLSTGFFQRYFESDGTTTEIPILQVSLARKLTEGMAGWPESCLRLRLTDGAFHYSGLFVVSSLESQCDRDNLVGNAENGGEIIAVTKMYINPTGCVGKKDNAQGKPMLMIAGYELLSRGHPILSPGVSHDGDKDKFSTFKSTEVYSVPWKNPSLPDSNGAAQVARPSAPRRQPQSFGSGNTTPISMITPYISKWRICGLCTAKDELKTTKARSGAGDMKVFSFELTDKDGASIRITGFNDAAERAYSIIQTDCSYYIAGGTVKQANKRFNTTGHDYELSINSSTEITPCHDQIPKPALVLKICPLQNIPSHKDEVVDVLAVVDKMEPVNRFISKQGRDCVKRDLQLIDQTGTVAQLTLWGDQAENFDEHALGQVISVKGALVKEWNGAFSLALSSGSKIELSPQLDEVPKLYEWYTTERSSGCGNEGCSKKVVQLGVDQYRCEKCDTTSDSFKWRYMVQAEITDLSGSIWVTMFSSSATKVFGMEAQQLGELKEADKDAYDRVLTDICFKYYNWRINAKPSTFNVSSFF